MGSLRVNTPKRMEAIFLQAGMTYKSLHKLMHRVISPFGPANDKGPIDLSSYVMRLKFHYRQVTCSLFML